MPSKGTRQPSVTAMFATALLVLAAQNPAPADPGKIDRAVAELTAAFAKEGTPQKRVEAIQHGAAVVDARVIECVQKGLGDKDASVVTAAVEALGTMAHPNALDALHAYAKREKKRLAEDEVLFPQVLRAIGRHGSPSSIELLKDDPLSQHAFKTGQARVMSLGNIRTKEAVEALIGMSKLVGPHRMDGLRNDMRVALARLTGRDLGPDSIAWQAWWQDNKNSFELAKEPPKLEPLLQRQWDRYWGLDKKREGEEGGEERGGGRERRRGGGQQGCCAR